MTDRMTIRGPDVLSQVVETFRMRGSVSGTFAVSPPWGYAMPESDHVALLVVARGNVHFEMEVAPRITLELAAGDVLALPHGHAYTISDAPGTPTIKAWGDSSEGCATHGTRTGMSQTEIIGICCELAGGRTNPMQRVLPPVIHCPGNDGGVARWLEPSVRQLAIESGSNTPGRTTILNRLSEVIFIQLIRAWLDRVPAGEGGWLRALADPQLASTLEAVHADPGKPWSLADLASSASMSRSAFAARFRKLVGETPLDYLTRLRMHRAATLLELDHTPLKEIVARSGYNSEAAFRTAFKKWLGESPGSYRAARSTSVGE